MAALSEECRRLLSQLRQRCPDALPAEPVTAGTVVPAIHITPDQALKLFPPAAAVAAGVDRFARSRRQPVKWREGDCELVIFPFDVSVRTGDGVIAVSIPVFSDQTDKSMVHLSFVVGDPKRPAGLVAATDARPTGLAAIVDTWGDALVAFAWHVVIEVATTIAGEAGRDVDGSRLVPIAIAASTDGLFVVPMARHTFDRARR